MSARWSEMAKHPSTAEIALFVRGRADHLAPHIRDCDPCLIAVGRWIMVALAVDQDERDLRRRRSR